MVSLAVSLVCLRQFFFQDNIGIAEFICQSGLCIAIICEEISEEFILDVKETVPKLSTVFREGRAKVLEVCGVQRP